MLTVGEEITTLRFRSGDSSSGGSILNSDGGIIRANKGEKRSSKEIHKSFSIF